MEDISKLYENLDEDQKMEVRIGIQKGLDVSCYANPEYMAIQMRQIRLGMEAGIDVSVYNKAEYDWFQMEEIRLGMQDWLRYEVYAKPEIDYQRMRQIRKGLQDGIDLSPFIRLEAGILEELRKALLAKVSIVDFIKEGYVVEQLEEIRVALEKKVDIRPYISTEFRGASIREICLGLEAGLPVSIYADTEYGWQQMREIRLGMEARVDVNQYSNSLYSWQQMQQLRLGLEEGLDIEQYRRFIYTAADMEQRRKALLLEEVEHIVDGTAETKTYDEKILIFVSKDEMEACIEICPDAKVTESEIRDKLKQSGICQGILTEELRQIVEEKKYGETLVIARGQLPKEGNDGWYEFFFDTAPDRSPRILEDGSADFKEIKWFELVKKDQKLACYHNASFGVAGYTVTGKFLKAKKGREKNMLRGQGFRVEDDGKTYISQMDGRAVYDGESRLDVSRVCAFENVTLATGNVSFDGTVYVRGNVGSGVLISATENVYVDGYVEAAMIKSGGEVFLRKGVNGNGSGVIEARGNITGQFFEEVRVIAGGDIVGQYCMNCDLHSENKISMIGNRGLLLGGTSRAARGIVAYNVGNKMGLRTVLNVGIDQPTIRQQQKINAEIEGVNRELAILNHSKIDFQNKYAPEVRNSMAMYLKIENAIYTKDLQLKYLTEERDRMEAHISEMKGAKVVVAGVLYEGTEIMIDNIKWKAFSLKDVTVRCKNEKIVVES